MNITKEHTCYNMNKYQRSIYSEYIQRPYKYYLTLTFKNNEKHLDIDLSYYLKLILKKIFGKHCKSAELKMLIIREEKPSSIHHIKLQSHYHILIEDNERIDLNLLAKYVIACSRKCTSMVNLLDKDYKDITHNYYKDGKYNSKKPVNLVEIETNFDKSRILNYLLKDVHKYKNNWYITSNGTVNTNT